MQKYNFREFLQRFIDNPDECELFETLKGLPSALSQGPWIAGGAIRRTLAKQSLESDIDYFFADEAQKAAFVLDMIAKGAWQSSENEHNVTFGIMINNKKVVVQAITIAYYANVEAVIDSFDFTITQFGYDGESLVCGDYSLWDLARGRLALHKLTFGVSTVRRLLKYTKQGYTACAGVLAAILEETAANPATINRNVQYVD